MSAAFGYPALEAGGPASPSGGTSPRPWRGGGGGGGGGGFGNARTFRRRLRVYSPSFLEAEGKAELARAVERGDKAVLCSSMLRDLQAVLARQADGAALIFELTNEAITPAPRLHVGVLEFSGEQHNVAFLPRWVMRLLLVEEGSEVGFGLRSLPPVKYLRLQPRDGTFFAAVREPKLALEEALRSFTAVTEGSELQITLLGEGSGGGSGGAADEDAPPHSYAFRVLEVRPENASHAASLVTADCELVFEQPEAGASAGVGDASAASSSAGDMGGSAAAVAGSAGVAPSPSHPPLHPGHPNGRSFSSPHMTGFAAAADAGAGDAQAQGVAGRHSRGASPAAFSWSDGLSASPLLAGASGSGLGAFGGPGAGAGVGVGADPIRLEAAEGLPPTTGELRCGPPGSGAGGRAFLTVILRDADHGLRLRLTTTARPLPQAQAGSPLLSPSPSPPDFAAPAPAALPASSASFFAAIAAANAAAAGPEAGAASVAELIPFLPPSAYGTPAAGAPGAGGSGGGSGGGGGVGGGGGGSFFRLSRDSRASSGSLSSAASVSSSSAGGPSSSSPAPEDRGGEPHADLFLSCLQTRPSRRTFTWAEFSSASSASAASVSSAASSASASASQSAGASAAAAGKVLDVWPGDAAFPAANELGSRVFYLAIEACSGAASAAGAAPAATAAAGPGTLVQWSITAEPLPREAFAAAAAAVAPGAAALPLPIGTVVDSRARAIRQASASASASASATATAVVSAPESAAPPAPPSSTAFSAPLSVAPPPLPHSSSGAACTNCGQRVPAAAMAGHEAFCRRNNTRCGECGAVVQTRRLAAHLHCAECLALCACAADLRKHRDVEHAAHACEAGCGRRLVGAEAHVRHARDECELRAAACRFCRVPLSQRAKAEHETRCGARSARCERCGRSVLRRSLDAHEDSGCQAHFLSGGSGGTPAASPFLRAASSAAAPAAGADFAAFRLDGNGNGNGNGNGGGAGAGAGAGAVIGAHPLGLAGVVDAVFAGLNAPATALATPAPAPAQPRPLMSSVPRISRGSGGGGSGDEELHYAYDDDDDDGDGDGDDGDGDGDDGGGDGGDGGAAEEERAEVAAMRDRSEAALFAHHAAAAAARQAVRDAVSCPSCSRSVPCFDDLSIHLLSTCPCRHAPGHLDIVTSLLGPGAEGAIAPKTDAEAAAETAAAAAPPELPLPAAGGAAGAEARAPPPIDATAGPGAGAGADAAAAAADSSSSLSSSSSASSDSLALAQAQAQAVGAGAGAGAGARRRRPLICPCCERVFPSASEDDVQVHILTDCAAPWADSDRAFRAIRPHLGLVPPVGGAADGAGTGAGVSAGAEVATAAAGAAAGPGAGAGGGSAAAAGAGAAAPEAAEPPRDEDADLARAIAESLASQPLLPAAAAAAASAPAVAAPLPSGAVPVPVPQSFRASLPLPSAGLGAGALGAAAAGALSPAPAGRPDGFSALFGFGDDDDDGDEGVAHFSQAAAVTSAATAASNATGGAGVPPPASAPLQAPDAAESAAVERLVGMGFARAQVVEAYRACDRDEELAVNLLLAHA